MSIKKLSIIIAPVVALGLIAGLLYYFLVMKGGKVGMAKDGDTVKIHYTGKLDDGSTFDSSAGREPLEFTLGTKQVIPGFENGVLGMKVGESKTIKIPFKDAYGPRDDKLVMVVDRSKLPKGVNPQVGEELQLGQPHGKGMVVKITQVSDSSITIDANHPLAGKDLTFDLQLVEIGQQKN